MSTALPVTDKEFESEILKKEGISVVDFYAEWCGPCKVMSPLLDELADKKPNINVRKINVDANPTSAEKYNIRSIPTLLFFKDGEIVKTKVGGQSLADLISIVEEL